MDAFADTGCQKHGMFMVPLSAYDYFTENKFGNDCETAWSENGAALKEKVFTLFVLAMLAEKAEAFLQARR